MFVISQQLEKKAQYSKNFQCILLGYFKAISVCSEHKLERKQVLSITFIDILK